MAGNPGGSASAAPVTLVTQTRVEPDQAVAFARWQDQMNAVVAGFPGYLDHEVVPPRPPLQVDWVIVQRFVSADAARAWLGSEERRQLLEVSQPWLVGQDDIHLVVDGGEDGAESVSTPVSAVISTLVAPGQEEAFRAWQRRVATSQAKFPGFQGYKLEPPVPGVQDDWVVILRFDSEPHLAAWLSSAERQRLVTEAADFTAGTHIRTVATGFDQWFRAGAGMSAPPPAAWQQNMLVLLALYPVVFLFGAWVQGPLLMQRAGAPFWLALFIGNLVGVLVLSKLVPVVSDRFQWWLVPSGRDPVRLKVAGGAVVVSLYGLLMLLFSRFP